MISQLQPIPDQDQIGIVGEKLTNHAQEYPAEKGCDFLRYLIPILTMFATRNLSGPPVKALRKCCKRLNRFTGYPELGGGVIGTLTLIHSDFLDGLRNIILELDPKTNGRWKGRPSELGITNEVIQQNLKGERWI